MTDQPGEDQIEFISAADDAQLRLQCFWAVAGTQPSDHYSAVLDGAKVLYDWIMGFDESDDVAETELSTESAPACTRKH